MADGTVTLGWNSREFDAGIAKAKTSVDGLSGHMSKAMNMAGKANWVQLLIDAAKKVKDSYKDMYEEFGNINDQADRMDMGAESVQRLAVMAKLSGTDINTVAKALRNVELALYDVENTKAQEALDKLGISANSFFRDTPEEQIMKLADGFAKAQEAGSGLPELMDLMKKAGPEMMPMLKMERDTLREISQMKVIPESQLKSADEMADKIELAAEKAKILAKITTGPGRANAAKDDEANTKRLEDRSKKVLEIEKRAREQREKERKKQQEPLENAQVNASLAEMDLLEKRHALTHLLGQQEQKIKDLQSNPPQDPADAIKEEIELLQRKQQMIANEKAIKKQAETMQNAEGDLVVKELQGQHRFSAADKAQRDNNLRQSFQRWRDLAPEMGDDWAKQQAIREAEANQSMSGKIKGHDAARNAQRMKVLDAAIAANAVTAKGKSGDPVQAMDNMSRLLEQILGLWQVALN